MKEIKLKKLVRDQIPGIDYGPNEDGASLLRERNNYHRCNLNSLFKDIVFEEIQESLRKAVNDKLYFLKNCVEPFGNTNSFCHYVDFHDVARQSEYGFGDVQYDIENIAKSVITKILESDKYTFTKAICISLDGSEQNCELHFFDCTDTQFDEVVRSIEDQNGKIYVKVEVVYG